MRMHPMGRIAAREYAVDSIASAKRSTLPDNEIKWVVRCYNALHDTKLIHDIRLAERLYRTWPCAIDNYDENGRYIGAVAHENGWTP